jgi:hypothetical protein
MRKSLVLLVVAAGCGAAPDVAGDVATDGQADSAQAPNGRTFLLQLDHGVFPASASHPSALVYAPDGFDATPPLNVVVYLHGFYNCVENVVRSSGKACTPGHPVRQAYALTAQLEASRKNALLVIPEVAYDQANADPGQLGVDGGLTALIDEVLGKIPDVGSFTLDDLGRVVVASHSGGYRAAAGAAQRGGLYVNEVWLLDSLYGSTDDFDAWVQSDLGSFGDASRRLADIYTGWGGTLANSQAMAGRAEGWVGADGVVDDRTTSTLSAARLGQGLVFKRSGLPHDGVPRYYFGRLLSTSGLPDKP